MTTAVYIVSPSDKVDAFASHVRSIDYDGRKVLVGNAVQDVRTVVFADGSPGELKKKLESAAACDKEWKSLRERVMSMLKAVHASSEDLRLFVHFGGQSEDEVNNFNKMLGQLAADGETWCCYAISFGNKIPSELFVNGDFSPPVGEKFLAMCQNMHSGKVEEFEHVRALRLLLSNAESMSDGRFDVGAIRERLCDIYGTMSIDVMSDSEEKVFVDYPNVRKAFHVDSDDGCVRSSKAVINFQELEPFLSILEREERHHEPKQ